MEMKRGTVFFSDTRIVLKCLAIACTKNNVWKKGGGRGREGEGGGGGVGVGRYRIGRTEDEKGWR